jgi:hypothetical protein
MSLQSFALCQTNDDRTKAENTLSSEVLRRDVFLERERVDARELPGEAVGGWTSKGKGRLVR